MPAPATPSRLADALRDGPVVLDGGLATSLEDSGHDLRDDLWSARLLEDDPQAIVAAHRAFIDAGASVVTTASYQASIAGFERRGHDRATAARLLMSSVELARRACAGTPRASRPLWIAAAIGPYGATLADGSEYRGHYGLSHAELVRFHKPRLALLAEAGPDVLALETVPDVREAQALLSALDGLGVPAWLSYTVEGERTRAGQPLADAFAVAADHPAVLAVGVNCCTPADATQAVAVAARCSGKPVVVYPNSGERWDPVTRGWRRGPSTPDPAALVSRWVEDGARLVGGCCRVGPDAIARIAVELA